MPLVNEIYKGNGRIRVLYVDPSNDIIIVIKMDERLSYPEIHSLQDFKSDIYFGNYNLEPLEVSSMPPQLTEKQLKGTEMRWNMISNYIKNEPSCYDSKERSNFVKETSKTYDCTKYAVNQVLYKFWTKGMTKATLVPCYHQRGGKGKTKTSKDNKLGRPTKYNYQNKYLNITEKELSQIKFVINNFYNTTKNTSLRKTYFELLEKYYTDPVSGNLVEAYPTEAQFRYHAKKYINPIKREGTRKFNKDLRGIVGSSKGEVLGPGDKYQIDATIADIYLVSARDHKSVIGRPTLYFITDVFSHMITGFYVGLEHPSWKGAIMALLNTFCNKQMICEQYGVKISKYDWPCCGLPKKILCDNGEMISKPSNTLIESLGIDVENAAAWRPDLKGIVEQSFHQLNLATKSILPGAVQPDFNVRGSHDYRKDARLTLKEYGQIVIYYILKYNSRLMNNNPLHDEDALRDHIPPIPLKIWNWGIINRSGQLRKMPEEDLKIALLPHSVARVTEKGIKFKNMCYTCKSAIEQSWFSNARMNKTWNCNIAYDPRDLSHIYILGLEKPELAEKTSAYYNLFDDWTEEDFDFYISQERNTFASSQRTQIENELEYNNEIEKIINNANERSKVVNFSSSKSIKGDNIRKERDKDKQQLRREESFVKDQNLNQESPSNYKDSYDEDDNILSNIIYKIQRDKRGE